MERLERSVGEIVPFHKLIKADTPIKKVQATADRFKKKKKKKDLTVFVWVYVCQSVWVWISGRTPAGVCLPLQGVCH